MWEFIKDNEGAINAVASVLTLGIWTLYFQLLLNSYRHRVRPKININRAGGRSTRSRCVISNMSAEAVYVEAIVLTLGDGEKRQVCHLSDLDVSVSPDTDTRSQLFQGPLSSGEFLDIGSFDSLIERARETSGGQENLADDTARLEVMVVGTYTAGDGLIAAERCYELPVKKGERLLSPTSFSARQARSRKELKSIERLMLNTYRSEANSR
ncbi:hypothetical protein [Roseibium salinum]|uniref:Uncharacterized protein n=1 Tax=Roseibium salinum TaxID=1604349 RepID=A0ABT3QXS2_9HYPH|nr:hypothetical protein [Roseibium sp. DSM 29163]MCX2721631.1 hypothetical protein [Roseibium sp. DSM 29163]